MSSYRFLDFKLSEGEFCLSRSGQRIALEPKALRVLTLLVRRAGHLVDKRELRSEAAKGYRRVTCRHQVRSVFFVTLIPCALSHALCSVCALVSAAVLGSVVCLCFGV